MRVESCELRELGAMSLEPTVYSRESGEFIVDLRVYIYTDLHSILVYVLLE